MKADHEQVFLNHFSEYRSVGLSYITIHKIKHLLEILCYHNFDYIVIPVFKYIENLPRIAC